MQKQTRLYIRYPSVIQPFAAARYYDKGKNHVNQHEFYAKKLEHEAQMCYNLRMSRLNGGGFQPEESPSSTGQDSC